jgi:mxaJ protein
MVQAVARGEIDAAIAWGPQAAYFAARAPQPLEVRAARAPAGLEGQPFEFDISMGVRRGDKALRDELDAIIDRRRADIDAILREYGVPRTDSAAKGSR